MPSSSHIAPELGVGLLEPLLLVAVAVAEAAAAAAAIRDSGTVGLEVDDSARVLVVVVEEEPAWG